MNALFADVSNLYHNIRKKYGKRKLDYAKLKEMVEKYGPLYRCTAYGYQDNSRIENFISALQRIGYDTKCKESSDIANWDTGITVDVIQVLDRVDTITLVSSNENLVDLIHFAQNKGVRCLVVGCSIPDTLKETADLYLEITEELLEAKRLFKREINEPDPMPANDDGGTFLYLPEGV